MADQVRMKFLCEEKVQTVGGYRIKLQAAYGGSDENDKFFNATPWGQMEVSTLNERAAAMFVPGKYYYADFTPASE